MIREWPGARSQTVSYRLASRGLPHGTIESPMSDYLRKAKPSPGSSSTPFHMEDTDAAQGIDWTTVSDDKLELLASDTIDVQFAKIDEQARRQREKVQARRRQQEQERLQKEAEERRREEEEQCRRAAEEQRRLAEESANKQLEQEEAAARAVMANELVGGSEEDAEGEVEEDEVGTINNTSRAPSTGQVLRLPSPRSHRTHPALPVMRGLWKGLCRPSGLTQQAKRCQLPAEKGKVKRKDDQVSPRGGDKRKRQKKVPDDDDDDIEFIGLTTAKAGPSAFAPPDTVAQVLDRRLGEITALLRDLLAKVGDLAEPKGETAASGMMYASQRQGCICIQLGTAGYYVATPTATEVGGFQMAPD
ncbi:hypothetical protein EDD15DRAFT_2203163 [Pisolithus albus]|nr:hypothetical protein EDD15DRAFT_2203163 [Pisolithus albus]